MKWGWILSMLFSVSLRWSCDFYPWLRLSDVYTYYFFIYYFVHPYDETNLVMSYDLFRALNSISKYLFDDSYSCIYQSYWPVVFLFFEKSLSGFISSWYWFHGMSLKVFLPLELHGKFWKSFVFTSGKIHQVLRFLWLEEYLLLHVFVAYY